MQTGNFRGIKGKGSDFSQGCSSLSSCRCFTYSHLFKLPRVSGTRFPTNNSFLSLVFEEYKGPEQEVWEVGVAKRWCVEGGGGLQYIMIGDRKR